MQHIFVGYIVLVLSILVAFAESTYAAPLAIECNCSRKRSVVRDWSACDASRKVLIVDAEAKVATHGGDFAANVTETEMSWVETSTGEATKYESRYSLNRYNLQLDFVLLATEPGRPEELVVREEWACKKAERAF